MSKAGRTVLLSDQPDEGHRCGVMIKLVSIQLLEFIYIYFITTDKNLDCVCQFSF